MKSEKKLEAVFSQFIRLSNSDSDGYCKCYTCGISKHWTLMHCGHFRKRAHKNTKYNLKNNKPQCYNCNVNCDGMYEVFAENLDKEYGKGTSQQLLVLSNAICKLSESDYKEMLIEYREKVRELLNKL